jgi:PAS domain S-box-containing protein
VKRTAIVHSRKIWRLASRALQPAKAPERPEIRLASVDVRKAHERANFARAPIPMLVLDAKALVTDVSDRCLDLLGYGSKEVVGHHLSEFQDQASAYQSTAGWSDFLARGEARDVECAFIRRDGSMCAVLLSATVERSRRNGEVSVIAALVDVTCRKSAETALMASEEGLRHAQKMETVGELTGGIAHDFNNILQAVTSNLELIRGRIQNDRPDVTRLAESALDAADKAAKLTSQLLGFSRNQQLDPKPLDPVEVIGGVRDLLAQAVGDRITLRVSAQDTITACLADRNQLECALLNLVINARDAIDGGGGAITISVREERVQSAPAGWPNGGAYVRIAVRDDGPGMPEEVRRRAFEPFFTTKGPGKGSGLGLAQIHAFAHQSGGMAAIESAPGKGTEVAIFLPSSDEPLRRVSEPSVSAARAELGTGQIVLIVEDDAMVSETLAETLCELGYQIVEAADADAALALLESGTSPDLVVTDLSMPGSMDGLDFANTTRRRFSALPVVLTTGHVIGLGVNALPPGVNVVKKPYSRAEIAAAVQDALAAS